MACTLCFGVTATSRLIFGETADIENSPSGARFPAIDALMTEYMKRFSVPGGSLAFMRGKEVLYSAAYGLADLDHKVPVGTESRFRIASNSKAITAAGIFKLIEDGRLALSSRIFGQNGVLNRFATDHQPQREWLEAITVHHLLTHTSGGWTNDEHDPMFLRTELGHEALIAWTLQRFPLESEPGKHYAYSNFGYCLLGRVIESASGKKYREYIQESVLRPAGINDMEIGVPRPARQEVRYYSRSDGDPYGIPIERMDSHGGWIGTSADQARFLATLFAAANSDSRTGIVNPESLRLMTTGTEANSGYGCGLVVNTAGNAWHGGSLPGTTSLMVHTRSGLTWAAALNTRDPKVNLGNELDHLMWQMARTAPEWKA